MPDALKQTECRTAERDGRHDEAAERDRYERRPLGMLEEIPQEGRKQNDGARSERRHVLDELERELLLFQVSGRNGTGFDHAKRSLRNPTRSRTANRHELP